MTVSASVDVRSLKAAKPSDLVLIMMKNGFLKLYQVVSRVGTRGRTGFTSVELKNVVSGRVHTVKISTEVPYGVKMIRRVSRGVNAATLRKMMTEVRVTIADAGESADAPSAPESELPEAPESESAENSEESAPSI